MRGTVGRNALKVPTIRATIGVPSRKIRVSKHCRCDIKWRERNVWEANLTIGTRSWGLWRCNAVDRDIIEVVVCCGQGSTVLDVQTTDNQSAAPILSQDKVQVLWTLIKFRRRYCRTRNFYLYQVPTFGRRLFGVQEFDSSLGNSKCVTQGTCFHWTVSLPFHYVVGICCILITQLF